MNQRIFTIQQNILSWYAEQGRDLPWRRTTDPYKVRISEVMSQQTQVQRVLPYYHRRIKRIPDVQTLTDIDTKTLLGYRSGLGFNSRAMRLRACAKIIVEKYNSYFPTSREELLQLPGIGPYTAGAICAFAYNQDVPVVDTNIRRVLIFLFNLDEGLSTKQLEDVAMDVLPRGQARDWYNALMDYGALHLTVKKTKIKPKSKQSRFNGSDRQVRGWIIKKLTEVDNQCVCVNDIAKQFPKKNTQMIVQGLVNENIVKVAGNFIELIE